MNIAEAIFLFIATIIMIAIFGFILAFPVMWLWNWVMPIIVPEIASLTVGQAWGLMVLCGLLFKSVSPSK